MTEQEAQNIAFKWANLNSLDITLAELKQALVVLANFYEDNKKKGGLDEKNKV